MLNFSASVKEKLGFEADMLNIGGGMGVRYLEDHPIIDYGKNIMLIAEK